MTLHLPPYVIQVCFCREHFGAKHPKYSDTLLDYGFYLLNVDNICQSVAIYQVPSRAKCLCNFSSCSSSLPCCYLNSQKVNLEIDHSRELQYLFRNKTNPTPSYGFCFLPPQLLRGFSVFPA